ncbi:hypothetical protein [Nostoc sp. C052]|uniref:hypothetical protein n=1 Tax=Nostoc sp. C052 TaxID=2576902 RepID=UPI001C4ABFC3|nr:hypothetical protein [Nostoc sp. C052]
MTKLEPHSQQEVWRQALVVCQPQNALVGKGEREKGKRFKPFPPSPFPDRCRFFTWVEYSLLKGREPVFEGCRGEAVGFD